MVQYIKECSAYQRRAKSPSHSLKSLSEVKTCSCQHDDDDGNYIECVLLARHFIFFISFNAHNFRKSNTILNPILSWVRTPVLLLTVYVSLGKSLNVSDPQFSHL